MINNQNINKKEILSKVTPVIEQVASQFALTVLEVDFVQEFGTWHLRVFIYSPEHSISHGDCENMTKGLSEHLNNLIPVRYNLEVSSPGIERKLKSPLEYNVFKGHKVDVKLKQQQDNLKRFTAKIIDYTHEEGLKLEVLDTGEIMNVKTENISLIRLKADF